MIDENTKKKQKQQQRTRNLINTLQNDSIRVGNCGCTYLHFFHIGVFFHFSLHQNSCVRGALRFISLLT